MKEKNNRRLWVYFIRIFICLIVRKFKNKRFASYLYKYDHLGVFK